MRIGLMGGTFNPIHTGHLIISEYIKEKFPLDKVIFVPSNNPPHKELEGIISASHRHNLAILATENNQDFEVSNIELERKGKSYTIDTIKEFKSLFPNDDLYFLIGGDTLFKLIEWHNIEELFQITNFIVIGRDGFSDDDILRKIKELKDKYGARIDFVDGPIIEISSTKIRENIEKSHSIKYLVPEKVEEYIYHNKLYISEE